jgi:hypothetical protein
MIIIIIIMLFLILHAKSTVKRPVTKSALIRKKQTKNEHENIYTKK